MKRALVRPWPFRLLAPLFAGSCVTLAMFGATFGGGACSGLPITMGSVSGSYSAVTLTLVRSGSTLDYLAIGARLQLRLAPDGAW